MRVIALLLGVALSAAGCDRRAPAPEQDAGTVPEGAAPAPAPSPPAGALPQEAGGAVDRSHRGEAAPDFAFADAEGRPTTLAAFRGRPVLVNLWATWCAPCVREMPTLDALAARQDGSVRVVAIAQDLDPAKVAPFLAERGLRNLVAYRDADLRFTTGMGVNLPTTILYDAAGREVWRVTGALDWAGAPAARLIAEGAVG